MKRSTAISIGLILLGLIFEYLYLGTDKMLFVVKFWLLGVICILTGFIGLWLFTILPMLDHREETPGELKEKSTSEKIN